MCSASWMSAATTCREFCCQVLYQSAAAHADDAAAGFGHRQGPLAHDLVSRPSTKTILAR